MASVKPLEAYDYVVIVSGFGGAGEYAARRKKKSDFILNASPSVWKQMIKKEVGFVSAFMTNKIKLDKGSAPKVIALAPKSGAVVGAFNEIDTEWPDVMSPQRLQEYKAKVAEFRQRLKIRRQLRSSLRDQADTTGS